MGLYLIAAVLLGVTGIVTLIFSIRLHRSGRVHLDTAELAIGPLMVLGAAALYLDSLKGGL